MALENSEIRKILLEEHDRLRGQLRSIEAELDRVAAGDLPAQAALHDTLKQFLATFLRHAEHEEQLLRPVLEHLDAWGPQRIAKLDAEHYQQRAQVLRLAGLRASATPAEWVVEVRSFVAGLFEEMAAEEKECLDPAVLRDDVIAIDSFGG